MLGSVRLREEGNEFYRAAFQPDSTPETSLRDMERAHMCFIRAANEANSPEEASSANKNVANATWKIANLRKQREDSVSVVFNSFHTALKSFQKAINFGMLRDATWLDGVWQSQKRCLADLMSSAVELLKGRQRAKVLEEAAAVISLDDLKATCYVGIVQALYFNALERITSDNFRDALSLLHDCHYPLEEAARLFKGDIEHDSKVLELRKDVMLNMCIAESVQARKTGDSILENALENDENLNIDLVWTAADHYKQAIILTREKQVEYEAAALSRLGSLYYKVLKLKIKAKENFLMSLQLAMSLSPRCPNNEDWFKECKQSLDELQRANLQAEEEEREKERRQYREMLDKEIKHLDSLHSDWTTQNDEVKIKIIYRVYPPVNKKHTMLYCKRVCWDDSMRRKCLQQAIVHYHPDKVDEKEHGMKMKVLCEEITKVLTRHYNCRKGC